MRNDENAEFYRKMKLDTFKHFAEVIGLQKGKDIELIMPYLKNAESVLEYGSGYGRVVKFLKENGFQGKITGVERIINSVEFLKSQYHEHVNFINEDIRDLDFQEKVDAILWMWSGILECEEDEQAEIIQKSHQWLHENGVMIIEAPFQKIEKVGKFTDGKHIQFETDWGVLNACFAFQEDIESFAQKAGFSSVEMKKYFTDSQLERAIYILKK